MRKDKKLAIVLRKNGKSYSDISQELGIPKSTMHYWFRDAGWSKKIKAQQNVSARALSGKSIAAYQRQRWERWRQMHQNEAREQFPTLKSNPLFLAGIMLYWGEGDHARRGGQVRLTNTDARMISIFSKFFKEICHIPIVKIRPALFIYPDLEEKACKKYWSRASGISIRQFQKTQILKGRHPTKRLSYGVCTLHVNSGALKEKLFIWEELWYKEFQDAGVA